MIEKKQEIIIKCPDCGHTEFEMPDHVKDEDLIKCNNCGHEKTKSDWRVLGIKQAREVAKKQAVDEARKIFKDAFK